MQEQIRGLRRTLAAPAALSLLLSACAGGDGGEGVGEDSASTSLAAASGASGQAQQGPPLCSGEARPKPLPPGVRRNVILVVADGRQLEDEIATSRYLHGRDFAMIWHWFPYQGYVATWDVTSYNKYAVAQGAPTFDATSYDPLVGYDPAQAGARPYPMQSPPGLLDYLKTGALPLPGTAGWWPATDSASAATAMSTGAKTDDGNIAWLPGDPVDGALPTVGDSVRAARGMSYGIVSTQAISAATPSAFAAHNPSRSNASAISDEIVSSTKPEVVIGGGHPTWRPGNNSVSAAAYAALASSTEYVFVERTALGDGGAAILAGADQAVAENRKLFGLFGGKGGSMELGTALDQPGKPSIVLGSTENPTLADAAEAALRVLGQNRSGFFLMVEQGDIDTANHANNYAQMIACNVDLERAVARIIQVVNRPGDDIDWRNTVLIVVADHTTGYLRLNPKLPLGRGDLPAQDCSVAPCSYVGGEVSYGTGGHSNELVHLSILGYMAGALSSCEGREYPGTHVLNNTVLHSFMLRAAGL